MITSSHNVVVGAHSGPSRTVAHGQRLPFATGRNRPEAAIQCIDRSRAVHTFSLRQPELEIRKGASVEAHANSVYTPIKHMAF